ncbi:MAG: universal stress protein [Deltaproteobacteria bacterium]|nr:universal stress protein [Deltaproteobacteria bacterium]MBW2070579.1 universal stress protein [Deltaproteobacteria bacterium]
MVQYSNILFCSDFSEEAEMAFHHAVDFCQRYGARLHVLHVLHSGYKYLRHVVDEYVEEGQDEQTADPELLAKAEEDLKKRYQGRLQECREVNFQVRVGVPFVEIVRYARENKVDFIIMGASGSSELNKQSFGSTVENVARRAHCHVMAIRNPEKAFKLPG